METDNFNNSVIEEKVLRNSKSRSMTPGIRSASNNEDLSRPSTTEKNEISSARLSTGWKVVTSSTKSVSKTKTVGNRRSLTEEKNLSQEKSTFPKDITPVGLLDDESLTRLSGRNDAMELRSERRLAARQSNRPVANGTGRDETTTTSVLDTLTRKQTRIRTSDYSSDEEDENNRRNAQSQRVFNVYQGDYWNKLPKTDFTYSPASKLHCKEVAPGVYVKPNMSRITYRTASEVGSTPYILPTREFRKIMSTKTTTKQSRLFNTSQPGTKGPVFMNEFSSLDSDEDEVDSRVRAEVATASVGRSSSIVNYLTSFFTAVWTIVTTTWTTTVETTKHFVGFQNDGASVVRTRVTTYSWWSRMLDYVYLLPAYLASADLGILSSTSKTSRPKYLRLFSALMMLLLLLLCGWWLFRNPGVEGDIETSSHTSLLFNNAWAATRGWMETLAGWCRTFGGGIFLSFAAKQQQQQQQQEESTAKESESYNVLPMTVVTTPLGTAPPGKTPPGITPPGKTPPGITPPGIIPPGIIPPGITPPGITLPSKGPPGITPPGQGPPGITPPGTTPPPFQVDALIDQLLASERLEQFVSPTLSREQLVEEILTSGRFTDWIASRVDGRRVDIEALSLSVVSSGHFRKATDADSLAYNIWSTGRLQRLVDALVDERRVERETGEAAEVEHLRASLQQQLDDKSQYFEVHSAKLAREIAHMKEELEIKVNASITEMKANLRDELMSNEEQKRAHEKEIRLLKIQLEKCCNKTPAAIPWKDVEKYVLRYVAGMYGVTNTDKVDHAQLRDLMGNMFVGRQQFEAALANVTARHMADMREASEQSRQTIKDTMSNQFSGVHVGVGGGLTDGQVLEIVNRAIMTYDADKTGMVDYALESSGGSVVSTRCTESYYKHSASMTLFGIPYWYPVNTPRTVIQPGVHPGECWAFRGSHGFLVIQLAGQVRISSFSVEHIPRSLALSGNIDSAPKDFSVWGLETENDFEPTELGKYTYQKNSTSLQYFLVARTDIQPFKTIELRIDSNHGNLEYTCLYRFRVHGTWVSY